MENSSISDQTAISEVIDAEERRFQAITDNDFAAIDDSLADEVWMLHALGYSDDKATFIAGLKSANSRRTFTRGPADVRIYGDIAVLIGNYTVDIAPNDGSQTQHIDATGMQVWVRRDERWQLAAHHSAPLTTAV